MKKAEPPHKKERVQLDFAPEALARLDELKDDIGATTRAETIRQALRLFNWFVSESRPDDTITITDRDGKIVSKFKAILIHDPKSTGSTSYTQEEEEEDPPPIGAS
ncbi:MAG: hypothetical protein NVS2B12_37760 [Ktedonobacteraceae bacterium]